jgi:N-formylmaleamate deformylase
MTQQGKENMKKSESVFFRSGELRMHAARYPGSGDRPIVVVPGITTPAGAFAVAATRLADVGSDVYVLDMRGRGLSQRVPYGAHRAGDYADDVLALIDQAGLHQPVLVGHSLGARVVAAARARVPGASAGVVAIDPPMSGPGRRPYPMTLDRFLGGLHGARAGHGTEQARADYPTWTEEEVRARGEWLASCDEVAVVESYAWFHLEAFEPVWREVEPPALLLYGAGSPVVTEADADLLRRVNPRAEVVAVPGSGHMVPWDNLAQTVAEVGKFLSRVGASA